MADKPVENIPREAVWIMAIYVSFMVVGLFVALLIPFLLRYDGPTNGSITLTPPPVFATPRLP
jgi:hypothetical protein